MKPLFVVVGNAPYRSTILTSKQMVTAQIAKRYPTLYVEPPPLTLDPLVKPAERGRYFDFRHGVRQAGAGEPFVVCPPPLRQGMDTRWAWLDRFNQRRLGRFIRRQLARFDYDRLVLISFVYNAALIADELRPDLFVYYCIDLMSEIRIPYSKPATIDCIERETIRRADLVFAISQPLVERVRPLNARVVYAPHGVQYDLFAQAVQPGPLPADLAAIAPPRVGFVGVLAHWLDYDLLIELARLRRHRQFVFVGPVGPHVDPAPLAAEPNVHLLGERERERVVDYLRGCDVCLVPFLVNDLTVNSNPLKVYDYLAAGRPVVSTPLPEVGRFSPPVRLAADALGFAEAIDDLLRTWSDAERQSAMALAATLSWDKRVDDVLAAVFARLEETIP